MKIFNTKEESHEFAKNADVNFKKQLKFLTNHTFTIDEVRPFSTFNDLKANFKTKMKLIPVKFKPMISVGNYVVYLYCDIEYTDLSMVMVEPPHTDLFDAVKKFIDVQNSQVLPSFKDVMPSLHRIPREIFMDFSKLIGLSDFGFMDGNIIIK